MENAPETARRKFFHLPFLFLLKQFENSLNCSWKTDNENFKNSKIGIQRFNLVIQTLMLTEFDEMRL